MSATKTLAFILSTQDYRDTSILAHFYTRDFGKVNGIIKGVRDARARYGSTLEPFSLNEILFYKRRRGGDLHQVTQVDALDLYPDVREDLERLAYASYFTELIDELTENEDPQPELFDLLKDALVFLGSGASSRRAARIFEIKFFQLLGLMPETKSCVSCQAPMPDPAFFNIGSGGVQCKACAGKQPGGAGAQRLPVSHGTLKFIDHVQRVPVSDLGKVKVAQEVGVELEKILRRFVDFHLANKLKTVVFLEKMGFNS